MDARDARGAGEVGRRGFLGAVGAAGAAAFAGTALGGPATGRPAAEGGEPVRKTPLQARSYGPQYYDDEEKRELLDVLESRSPFRWWGMGRGPRKVLEFEREYAAHMGTKYALAVTSGTTALMTAMAALEVGPGDEVVLPAWTWLACYDAIVLSGALPVFAEIDESFGIDPADVERKVTPHTKAIMAVHLQGGTCDMDAILSIARARKVRVLEDCAQCVGGRHRGKYVGSIGDIGIYSFQFNKTITSGEGGAVVTSDPALFERAFRFHDCGVLRSPYAEDLKGGMLAAFSAPNFRMNEFTGAVLRAQLRKLDTICSRLRRAARIVKEGIAGLPGLKLRKAPDAEGDLGVAVFIDCGTAPRRDRFMQAMATENVPASPPGGSVILPVDPRIARKVTVHPAWPSFSTPEGKAIRYGPECCPRTIDILGRHAGVILDPTFSDDDLADIAKAIRKVWPAMG